LGFSYKKMEDEGVMLPVLTLNIKYIKPAFYDDLITVKTCITEVPGARIHFTYEMYNQNDVLLNKADTTLVFLSVDLQKPTPAPDWFTDALKPYFSK
jgi:acyl-CoA thioester hydrolase